MNLRSLDLNLLLVFDAIHNERSISRAAQKLHLSQPTVSNALARLRERLSDPLFERSAQGMVPTLRARQLAGPVRQALQLLEGGLRNDEGFDFARAEREFVVAVEDYGEAVILPGFTRWLASVAPQVCMRIRAESASQLKAELREGTVDLALDYFPLPESVFRRHLVLTERLMSLSRQRLPGLEAGLSLAQYVALPHVVLGSASNARPMVDLALAKRGLARRIAVTVPHFISMPLMVQKTDLLCTLPERMAQLYAHNFGLQMHELPIRTPVFPIYLLWHAAQESDPGHAWFRAALVSYCQAL